MCDVLLGHGYYLRLDPKQWAAAQPYPPLGTLYAAAVLREAGHRVGLFDAMLAPSEREWEKALDRARPSVAVLFEDSFNYLSKMCLLRMREATFTMIRAARARGSAVIAAGSDATDHVEAYLDAGATAVAVGEADLTVAEAVSALAGGRPLADVAGLCLRVADGTVRRTAARAFLRDLDALPRPAWDLVDLEAYRGLWRARHRHHSMNLVTTRGCPYHCNWCAKPIYGQRYAVRRAEAVADEVAWLKARYAPDHLWFADDVFGLRPGWVEEYAAAVLSRGAALPFRCQSRADLLGPRTVDALARAGCRTVWLGAESGSQPVLDAMEKGITVEQIRESARRLRAAGIEVALFLQFGYPGEGWAEIEETLALVRACRPDEIGISVSYPLPGTRFHQRVAAGLGAKRNWVDSDDLDMMFDGAFTSAFYRQLHRVAHKEFRLARLVRRWRERRPPPLAHSAATLAQAALLPLDRARLRRLGRGRSARPALPFELAREAAARPSAPPA
jgi:anaerobic magnesium-protoporphyrin IX monomethyl ester cyclase